ncbi:hypothetical protein BDU57DRAFT_516246 [Ampelomyces quisqualis]|uniref:Uncharacterized protein n=1 Tax=Ampelomyces quisqualis TaxID=50730 RepID=A0A6A5QLH8_AMPQU|nr:hypothetical protein BDU57DRAFT_516246 [Ampelomyces quisqualis]
MKTEALEAITSPTMRPSALEAAARPMPDETMGQLDGSTPSDRSTPERPKDTAHTAQSEHVHKPSQTPEQPFTPFGQQTDGTESAAKAVEVVVHGMKVAVDGAITWAEKKVEKLGSNTDNTGPYTSPATCAPSDLDPIASGVLPAMSLQRDDDTKAPEEKNNNNEEEGGEEETADDKKDQEKKAKHRG